MRVTREQAVANLGKVLHLAGTLFRQHGFDGIGVADIMKRAGLTPGGFYGQLSRVVDDSALSEGILQATATEFGRH
ncbi:MAG TPA: TetR/AcrR family transcriptional regulator [Vicinamibacterales bacterium]|jgi:TetR/AcrR family transcriptional repressor of nem operon|nr:TetR/AcrR family transcriptional regulator [Vicinamibacterales bacterium]